MFMKKMLIAQVKRIKDIHSIAIRKYLDFNLKKNHSVKANLIKFPAKTFSENSI